MVPLDKLLNNHCSITTIQIRVLLREANLNHSPKTTNLIHSFNQQNPEWKSMKSKNKI